MTERDHELYLAIGRLEGKVDALTAMFNATQSRLDNHETRLNQLEQDTASLAASSTSGKTWISTLLGIGAVIISAIALFMKGPT